MPAVILGLIDQPMTSRLKQVKRDSKAPASLRRRHPVAKRLLDNPTRPG
jgi:hypothetical protein